MTATQIFCDILLKRFCAPRPTISPGEWCEQNVRFDEPEIRGSFSFAGREYLRDVVNDVADLTATDFVYVFGTGTGKTISFIGHALYEIANCPVRGLWVFPSADGAGGARRFVRTRLIPTLKASPIIREKMPVGVNRFDVTSDSVSIAGTILDFVGSNSPAQVAANRCSRVRQDEVDKFFQGNAEEPSASYNADRRTDGVEGAKRFKASSPTLVSGLIWIEYMKSDQQRRFLPCPHCGKFVLLAWSKQFTVFQLLGCEAFVRWDSSAKGPDGEWDYDAVEKSAHYGCPFCKGKILDVHKFEMDKRGEWRATAKGFPKYRGRHLPSLYSASSECRVGKLAVEFLKSKRSVSGVKGFINSRLAEPHISQETSIERIELITAKIEKTDAKILTVDCQQKPPFFYWIVRGWENGNSHGIKAGMCDTFEEIREIQQEHKVVDSSVWVDSGFRARTGETEVYRNCAAYGEFIAREGKSLLHLGWLPTKGFPGYKRWKHPETGVLIPYHLASVDPFMGTSQAGEVEMNLFQFSGDYFKDILENLRARRTGYAWSVHDKMFEDMALYWKHLDGEHKITIVNKITGREKLEWRPRHRDWPQHWFDMEVLQIAAAMFAGFFTVEEEK